MACYVFLRSNGDSVLQHKAQSNFESREMIREVYENNWSKATQIREGVENSKI